MNPIIHAELSWLSALKVGSVRDRRLIVLAGIAPDVDGLTILAGQASYDRWHHLVFHGCFSALLTAGLCGVLARKKRQVAVMAFLSFHLHLFCDILGSGPDWPIAYFWPLSDTFYGWKGGWELVSWQNTVIGLATTLFCLATALFARRTFVEVFSTSVDRAVVTTVRARFHRTGETSAESQPD